MLDAPLLAFPPELGCGGGFAPGVRDMRRAATLLVVATLLLMGCSDAGDDDDGAGVGEEPAALAAGTWTPTKGLPFQEPVQAPAVRDPGVKDLSVTLDVRQRTIQVSGEDLAATPFHDQVTDAAGKKSDAIDGPTLHVSQGGKITVTFINGSGQDSNIHYHGLHVSPKGESDNVFQVFKPGTTRTSIVDIPANHPVGTYWYHVHMHGNSEAQVMGGLSGMLIVEGVEMTLNAELRTSVQKQFAIREVRTQGGAVVNKATTTVQPPPDQVLTTVLVNGLSEPQLTIKEDEYQLWRFANIGVNMAYHLRLPAVLHAWIVAEDGNPVFAEGQLTLATGDKDLILPLPAGKRFDVLVYSEEVPPGGLTLDSVKATDPTSVLETLVRVAVEKASSIALAGLSPAAVDTDTSLLPDDGLRTTRLGLPLDMERTFTFSFGTAPDMLIAGEWAGGGYPARIFDPNRTDVAVNLGARERWTLDQRVAGDPSLPYSRQRVRSRVDLLGREGHRIQGDRNVRRRRDPGRDQRPQWGAGHSREGRPHQRVPRLPRPFRVPLPHPQP